MANRNINYDEQLAQEMKDEEFAQGYLLSCIKDHGDSVEEALKRAIEAMTPSRFAELSGINLQSVSKFVRSERKLKLDTLDSYLKVFSLKVKITLEKAT